MSLGELTAWQAGIDWARAGLSRTDYIRASKVTLMGLLDESAREALAQLGRDVFSHWFGQGLDDYRATGRV